MQTYVRDGRCPIDNNDAEQLMRQIALGRKNWLFVGSLEGGARAARLMTVVSSALRNDLDIERYLTDVLTRLLHGCQDYTRHRATTIVCVRRCRHCQRRIVTHERVVGREIAEGD